MKVIKWLFYPQYNPAQLFAVVVYVTVRWGFEDWFKANPEWNGALIVAYLAAFIILSLPIKRYWDVTPKEEP